MALSPELETLDQLQGGDMPLNLIRRLFADEEHFQRAVLALLHAGDVSLLDAVEQVPRWRWQSALREDSAEQGKLLLSLTERGGQKIS